MRSLRAGLAVALVACGSGKQESPAPIPPPRDAAVVDDAGAIEQAASDWKPRCKDALVAAAKLPLARRPRELVDNCRPCGDWAPLLRWDIRPDDGGPPRTAIEDAMTRCEAYCTPAAKQRFLNTLDDARGKRVRTPWRHLGELCGEAVSAKPDTRFASAPYFALDRIGRAAAADPALAKLLAAVELPLPPVSISGDGVTFPLAPVTKPETGRIQVTIGAGTTQHVGHLPRARLVGTGVHVDHGGEPYPGALTAAKDLPAAIARLAATEPGVPVTLVAPMGLPARRIADVVTGPTSFVLAAEIRAAPHGWSLLGHVPVAMVAAVGTAPASLALAVTDAASVDAAIGKVKDATAAGLVAVTLTISKGTATVTDLAKLLGALAYRDVKRVAVAR